MTRPPSEHAAVVRAAANVLSERFEFQIAADDAAVAEVFCTRCCVTVDVAEGDEVSKLLDFLANHIPNCE